MIINGEGKSFPHYCITLVANDNALVNLYRFVLFRIFVVDCYHIAILFYQKPVQI